MEQKPETKRVSVDFFDAQGNPIVFGPSFEMDDDWTLEDLKRGQNLSPLSISSNSSASAEAANCPERKRKFSKHARVPHSSSSVAFQVKTPAGQAPQQPLGGFVLRCANPAPQKSEVELSFGELAPVAAAALVDAPVASVAPVAADAPVAAAAPVHVLKRAERLTQLKKKRDAKLQAFQEYLLQKELSTQPEQVSLLNGSTTRFVLFVVAISFAFPILARLVLGG
jgi:hypothetical protein